MRSLKLTLCVFLLTICRLSFAQTGTYKLSIAQIAAIKTQANITANAIVGQDYKTLMKFTYPAIIEAGGGKEKMIGTLKKGMDQMKAQGFVFKSLTIAEVTQSKKQGKEIFAIVPDALVMNAMGGTITARSALIAISEDEGKHWYFVDTAPMQKETIRQVIPNLPKDLVIPEKSQPSFIQNH